jgi:hypothetical protein
MRQCGFVFVLVAEQLANPVDLCFDRVAWLPVDRVDDFSGLDQCTGVGLQLWDCIVDGHEDRFVERVVKRPAQLVGRPVCDFGPSAVRLKRHRHGFGNFGEARLSFCQLLSGSALVDFDSLLLFVERLVVELVGVVQVQQLLALLLQLGQLRDRGFVCVTGGLDGPRLGGVGRKGSLL